jgi:hypothetical protein
MISSGLCLFCRFIFVGFGCNKSPHSTWTTFSVGGHSPKKNYFLLRFPHATEIPLNISLIYLQPAPKPKPKPKPMKTTPQSPASFPVPRRHPCAGKPNQYENESYTMKSYRRRFFILPLSCRKADAAPEMGSFSMRRRISHHSSGMALVLVLGAIVLLTVLVVAFLASARTERTAARSQLNQTEARLLSENVLSLVTAQIREARRERTLGFPNRASSERSRVPSSRARFINFTPPCRWLSPARISIRHLSRMFPRVEES